MRHLGILRVLLRLSVSCLSLAASPGTLRGHQHEPLTAGTIVRVSHDDTCCRSPSIGRLISVNRDSIVLQGEGQQGTRVTLRRSNVSALEAWHDAGSRTWRGAGLGLLIGAGAGAVYVLTWDCQDDEICGSFKPLLAAYAGAAGGAAGLLVGAIIGSQIRYVVWRRVPIPVRVGFESLDGRRAAFRLAVRF